jgi:signal transduction histidine kinase
MKLSAIMLFVFASMAFAAKGYSQSVRVTLNVNNSSLQKVLDEIEKQSEFHFFYNNKQVDISRNVTIKSNQKEISQVLNQLFAGTNIGYKILENSIILSPKQILETTAAQQQTTKKIKGLVTDETGSPVIGANIKEKETGNGTITDINGNFSLSVGTKSTIIISYIGYITKEEMLEYAGIIETNTELLLQLINDILDMSKIESGMYDFHVTQVDANQLMSEVEQVARLRIRTDEVSLSFAERLPQCVFHTDKNRLIQVLTNLVVNAIKFTSQGEIQIGYRLQDAHTLYFYVSDTGCGMSAEQCEHVFERFVKYNTFIQGTGLGLSICKMIIEKLGGEIGVQSESGKGSVFWFTLPYRASASL